MANSVYPGQIDGYQQIRVVSDRESEIISDDHNSLRDAVIKIEQTLGTSPAGIFGTVKARLDDAYSNIEAHVAGSAPKHADTVIESIARSGSPYSLSSGTVDSQLTSLLSNLNLTALYPGSGSDTFADAYALPASLVDSAITEIVRRLGSTGGSDAVGGASASSGAFSLSAGSLKDQVEEILSKINSVGLYSGSSPDTFADSYALSSSLTTSAITEIVKRLGSTSGAGAIGNDTITSSFHTYSAGDIQALTQEVARLLDEDIRFKKTTFDSFVVNGMEVSENSGLIDADVADGYLYSNGRLLEVSASTVTVNTTGATYYIYATISGDTVTLASTTSASTATGGSTGTNVLLHRLTHNGSAWTASGDDPSTGRDLRRFGSLTNNKDYFTVGDAGTDGYGADFVSLKSAVEHIRVASNSTTKIMPRKIVLVSDITISTSDEMGIDLDAYALGMEIDGSNRTIDCSVNSTLFNIDTDRVHIKDLNVHWDLTTGTSAAFGFLSDTNSTDGVKIQNCSQTSEGSAARAAYFLLADAINNTNNLLLSGNNVECNVAALTPDSTAGTIKNSTIIGNRFYQVNFNTQLEPCLELGSFCVVSDNIFEGGYDSAISLEESDGCVISNNYIIGGTGTRGTSGTAYMTVGISLDTTDGAANVVSNNLIKGITFSGILGTALSSGSQTLVSGNIIDGSVDSGVMSDSGIRLTGSDFSVVGNIILSSGSHGIKLDASSPRCLIANNVIKDPSDTGIILNGSLNSVIIGNYIYTPGEVSPNTEAGIEIAGTSTGTSVIGNYINGDTTTMSSGVKVSATNSRLNISGNYITLAAENGIDLTGTTTVSAINNNYIYFTVGNAIDASSGSNHRLMISGNYIENSQTGDGISIDGIQSTVSGNHIYTVGGNGIELASTADEALVAFNLVNTHTATAILASGVDNLSIIGNMTINPGAVSVYGIDLTTTSNTLLVGNRAEGGSSAAGFNVDATAGDGDVTAAGNLSISGSTPEGFTTSNNMDTDSNRAV